MYFLNRFLNGCNKYCALAKHQGKKYAQESLTMVIILFRTLFRPTVKKNNDREKLGGRPRTFNCSSDREKLLKFEAEVQEFANFLRSLEHFIQTLKGQNNFWEQNVF